MKLSAKLTIIVALIGSSLFLQAAQAQSIVKIDGSSTVYPITEAVAEEFQKSKKGAVKVTVGISGTGGGFKKRSQGLGAQREIFALVDQAFSKLGGHGQATSDRYDAV